MNYRNPKLKNALSSEYVLGTLRGRARTRYQQLQLKDAELRENVWLWEKRLNALGESLTEQLPDERVWRAVQQRLGFVTPKSSWRQSALYPVLALAASVLLAFILLWPRPDIPPSSVERVAIVQNADAEALWLIQILTKTLQIQATPRVEPQTEKDYELWMLTEDGRPPVSLGLLPKRGEKSLRRSALFDQLEVAALAVSLEPLGGSSTGQPSVVLFTTEIMTL